MEITKALSLCILSILLIRLFSSDFTLDLYYILKLILTASLYLYPFKKAPIPVIPPASPAPERKKVSFTHLTDLPIKKLDFDNIETSPLLPTSPLLIVQNPIPPKVFIDISSQQTKKKESDLDITIPCHKKKEKPIQTQLIRPILPSSNEIMQKAKEEVESTKRFYEHCMENIKHEYEQIVENSTVKVETKETPRPASLAKQNLNSLPVIPEKNESEFEFKPVEHKSQGTQRPLKPDPAKDFNPVPLGTKVFSISGVEAQMRSLENDKKPEENLAPHLVLPIYKVKPFSTQAPMLSSGTEFNPVPNDKNQVVKTSNILDSTKNNQNGFFVSKNKEIEVTSGGIQSLENPLRSGVGSSGMVGNQNGFIVGTQSGNSFAGGVAGGNTGVNPFAGSGSFSQSGNSFPNSGFSGGMTQPANPFGFGTNSGVSQPVNSFFNTAGAYNKAAVSNNPFTPSVNSFNASQPLNPFSTPEISKSHLQSSFPSHLPQVSNPFSTAALNINNPFSNSTTNSNPFINPTNSNPLSNASNGFSITNNSSSRFSSTEHNKGSSSFVVKSNENNNVPVVNPFVSSNPFGSLNSASRPSDTQSSSFALGTHSAAGFSTPAASNPFSNSIQGFSNPIQTGLASRTSNTNRVSQNSNFSVAANLEEITFTQYQTQRKQIPSSEIVIKLPSEELLVIINSYTLKMSEADLNTNFEKILKTFKNVSETKLFSLAITFSYLLVDSFLQTSTEMTTNLEFATNFVTIFNKLSGHFAGFSKLLEFEAQYLYPIFSNKNYSQDEASESWQLTDLKRLAQGGILQNEVCKEIKAIESLSLLLSVFYLKHCPNGLYEMLQRLSPPKPFPRQWLPVLVGVLAALGPSTRNLALNLKSLIDIHKGGLEVIPKVCNDLYFAFEVMKFIEYYNKLYGF